MPCSSRTEDGTRPRLAADHHPVFGLASRIAKTVQFVLREGSFFAGDLSHRASLDARCRTGLALLDSYQTPGISRKRTRPAYSA